MEYRSENKICQNCKKDFIIEPEDFKFYEKIKVPAPTFCPECRLIRRLVWRDERVLYKKKCDSCSKNMVTIYDVETKLKVFCRGCWLKDNWDPMDYGQNYDFSKPFVEQFKNLFLKVPAMGLFSGGNQINSDYCNFTANNKDSYLCFGGRNNERLFYSKNTSYSKDTFDVFNGDKLELCYENMQCERCFKVFFSIQCEDCTDSYFLYDCRNCQNCFGCINLRNKNYCIWNKQYSREEYLKKIKEFDLNKFSLLKKYKLEFLNFYKKAIHKYANVINIKNSTGDNLQNARNCKNCFDLFGPNSENSKYTYYAVLGVKDSYDNYGMPSAERVYETIAIGFEFNENSDYCFSHTIKGSNRIKYSYDCVSCSDCFGCIGLRKKSYCILNKQYTKEEYEQMIPKIIQHMNDMPYIDAKGRVYRYGEFFPSELSPFAYNETIAQEYFPLTKKEALEQGYRWKDREERNYNIDIYNKDIADDIKEVNDNIINKVIECEHKGECNEQCTEAFKIIPDELSFYKRMNLPLPRLCPNCRHYNRLKQRNPLKLWHRKCMKPGCPNEFETSYSPERPEIVYCESCYNKEVY